MRYRFAIGSVGMLLAAWLGLGAGGRGVDRRPSILMVALDNVRWDHTSLSGYERDTTPILGWLAETPGARTFDRAYTAAAWSLPAYASLFTGRDALEHGVAFRTAAVDPGDATLAEMLSAYGFRTGAFCSGPHLDPATDLSRGFSTYAHKTPITTISDAVDGALQWLDASPDDEAPYFLFVHGYDAHGPYSTPSAYSEVFDRDYHGRMHLPVPGQRESCPWASPTRTCTHTLVNATTETLHAAQDQWAETELLFGFSFQWFRVPGGQRVTVGEAGEQEALWAIYQAYLRQSGEPQTLADLRRLWRRAPGHKPPDEEYIAAAVRALRATDLSQVLLDQDGAVFFDPAVPVRLLALRLDFEQEDVQHTIAHYDSAVLTADYHLGRLLRGLEKRGLLDDTVVIVLADHGEAMGEDGRFAHDGESGDKIFHVPLVVRFPDGSPPVRVETLTSLVDLVPTLADYLQLRPPAGIDGHSLLGEVGAAPAPGVPASEEAVSREPRSVVREASMCCYGVRTLDWELRGLRETDLGLSPEGMPIRPVAPIARDWAPMHWELHRDGTGPDVSAEHPDVVSALRATLADWPEEPDGDPRISHGAVADRPDLKEALRTAGYWGQGHQEPEETDRGGSP